LAGTFGLALGSAFPSMVVAEGGKTATMEINTVEGVTGTVTIELYPDLAPKTVERFVTNTKEGIYDGTAFHRVAKFLNKSVLVGGDPFTKETPYCYKDIQDKEICSEGKGYGPDGYMSSRVKQSRDDSKKTRQSWDKGGPSKWRKDGISKYKLEPEFGKIPAERGTIAMRRFNAPDSAGSQFIICLSDMTNEMDGNYATFGKITSGLEVLDKLVGTETWKSQSPLIFTRDDKKPEAVWGAWDMPVNRQGIEKITIQ